MKFYAHIRNNEIASKGQCKLLNTDTINLEISQEIYDNLEKYNYINNEFVINPNYDEQKRIEERKAKILNELNALDLKSIRALRANETDRLQELENQAIELRKEYNSL
jgi:hypothetical protein